MVALDLVLVVAVVAATLLLFRFRVDRSVVRLVVGVPFVLVSPGYAVVAALFPRSAPSLDVAISHRVNGIERLVLAVGLSVVVSPLLALAVSYTPLGLAPGVVVGVVATFTVGMSVIAGWRRSRVPDHQRWSLPVHQWVRSVEQSRSDSTVRSAALIVVVASLLVAAGGVGSAVYGRTPGETFTEFYLLTDSESGPLMNDYPDDLTVNRTTSILVGVKNHEHRPVRYTVIASLQRVSTDGGVETPLSSMELARTETSVLEHREEWNRSLTVRPTATGKDLKLVFALYRGDAPEQPTAGTPYEQTWVWVDVNST